MAAPACPNILPSHYESALWMHVRLPSALRSARIKMLLRMSSQRVQSPVVESCQFEQNLKRFVFVREWEAHSQEQQPRGSPWGCSMVLLSRDLFPVLMLR